MDAKKTYTFDKYIVAISLLIAGLMFLYLLLPQIESRSLSMDWQKPPVLVLQKCVSVNSVLEPNPFSQGENDFLIITTYAEDGPSSANNLETRRLSRVAEKMLNMHMVMGMRALAEEKKIVIQHIALVIIEKLKDPGRAGETLRQWILVDEDGDGRLNKAVFREIIQGKTADARTVEIPGDQLGNLQEYFETAGRYLAEKAKTGIDKTCDSTPI